MRSLCRHQFYSIFCQHKLEYLMRLERTNEFYCYRRLLVPKISENSRTTIDVNLFNFLQCTIKKKKKNVSLLVLTLYRRNVSTC